MSQDARWLARVAGFLEKHALLAYALYVGAVVLSVAWLGWTEGWRRFGVPAAAVPFFDLRSVQGALSSLDLGLDPRVLNPGDVGGRPMNYPLIWLAIADGLGWRDESAFLVGGVAIVGLFLGCAFVLLRRDPSAALLFALLSNATMLLVERGNNDLLVFALLYGVAALGHRFGRHGCLAAAVALKVYPLFALARFALRRPAADFLVALAVAALLLWAMSGEFSAIGKATPFSTGMSYGWPSTVALMAYEPGAAAAYSGLLLVLVLLFGRLAGGAPCVGGNDERREAMFVVGASVYCGTYLAAANWDYRLAMLVFCVPALARGEIGGRRLSAFLLAAVLVAMNVQWLHNVKSQLVGLISDLFEPETSAWVQVFKVPFFAFDHALKATLFGGLAGVLLARLAAPLVGRAGRKAATSSNNCTPSE